MPKSFKQMTELDNPPARLAALCRQSACLVADGDAALRLLNIAVRLDDLATDLASISQSPACVDWPTVGPLVISSRQSIH